MKYIQTHINKIWSQVSSIGKFSSEWFYLWSVSYEVKTIYGYVFTNCVWKSFLKQIYQKVSWVVTHICILAEVQHQPESILLDMSVLESDFMYITLFLGALNCLYVV